MRSPLHKVYREFPQLDRFDNKTCRRIARKAYRHDRFRGSGLHDLAIFVLIPLAYCALLMAVGFGALLLLSRMSTSTTFVDSIPIFIIAFIGVFYVGMLVLQVYLARWLQRRDLRRYLGNAACTACGYPIATLPTSGDTPLVRCPECGREQFAADPKEIVIDQ